MRNKRNYESRQAEEKVEDQAAVVSADDQQKIVDHVKELVNDVIVEAEEDADTTESAIAESDVEDNVVDTETKVDTKADPPAATTPTTTTTTTTTTRRPTAAPAVVTQAPQRPQTSAQDQGILARIGSAIGNGVGNLGSNVVAGGTLLVAAASPLWAPFLIGKKRRKRGLVTSNEITDHKPVEWHAKMVHTMIKEAGKKFEEHAKELKKKQQ